MRRWGLFIFHILFVAGKMTFIIMFFSIFNNIAVLKCILCIYQTIFTLSFRKLYVALLIHVGLPDKDPQPAAQDSYEGSS